MTKPATFVLCLTLIALPLAGCGRRGPLELPPGTPATQSTGSVNTTSNMAGDVNVAVPPPQPPATGSNLNPPSKGPPFLLDPLVK